LSTVHSAKGLEWSVVFVIWVTEGRFPPMYALRNPDDVDEERRLLYVAATRAKDHLYLISPLENEAWSSSLSQPRISRFLSDIPPHMVGVNEEPEPEKPTSIQPNRRFVAPAAPSPSGGGFSPGQRVSHPVFGLGRVLEVMTGSKIRIEFDHFGTKTLHTDYAGLQKAGW
jgi:DNA helicase-2/ATP-dependent DNA helicase PcrA